MWIEKWGSEATYERLAQALQHPAVKHSDLAAKYCHLNKKLKVGNGVREDITGKNNLCFHFYINA